MGRMIDARSLSNLDLSADVCVIGTGAGGAVVAKELAESGVRVIALEEGGHYTPKDFNRRPIDMMELLYRDGGLTGSIGRPAVAIPLGMAVGGTTLINSGTCFRTPDRVIRSWGLPGISPESMEPYFERVEKIVNVVEVPERLLNKNSLMMKRGAELLGLHGKPLRRYVKDCRGSGVCVFGCPTGAKQSTNISYIPKALEAGADVYTHAKAEEIVVERGRAVGVRFTRGVVRAKAIVLAAGSILSPCFLLRQKIALSSGQVGRNLTVHPCARIMGIFTESIEGWKGVPQSFSVDDLADEGIMIEGIHGPPSLIAMSLPLLGPRFLDALANLGSMAVFGIMIKDEHPGRVTYSRWLKGPLVTYSLGPLEVERLRKGIALAARAFLAAGAERLHFAVHGWEELSGRADVDRFAKAKLAATDFELAAFHPLGTCRMGTDRKKSVVDPFGETHDVPGLWIVDGSVLPSSLGVNPQITIMALATRSAEAIAERIHSDTAALHATS